MPLKKLISLLDEHGKKYVVMTHSEAYTAQEVAAAAHIPGKEMAKTVMVKVDGDMKLVVLPSTFDVDFEALKEALGAGNVELATENEFENLFPDCELGAIPPFGNMFNIDTLVAESLAEDEEIAFNAGTHRELIKMKYGDFEELAKPRILPLGVRKV
jgi:Ala-tRNA(Pro) deacylase